MTADELKKLAEAATPGPWNITRNRTLASIIKEIGPVSADSYVDSAWLDCSEENAAYIAAANPAAILKLLAIKAELVEALKEISTDYADRFDLECPSTNPGIRSSIAQARSALAKAEGGKL